MSTNVEMGRDTCVYGVIKVGFLGKNFHVNIRPSHFNMSEYEIRHFSRVKMRHITLCADISIKHAGKCARNRKTGSIIANC